MKQDISEFKPGDVFVHHSGQEYALIAFANEDASPEKAKEFPLMIIYKPVNGHSTWARPYEEFVKKFTPKKK